MDNNFIAIHHASFIISNLEKSKSFYHDILGLPISNNRPNLSFDGVWLDINDHQQIHLMLLGTSKNMVNAAELPEHGGRDHHTAFCVKNLMLIQQQLNLNEIDYTLSKSGRRALFCRDPDGNTLEILE